MSIILINTKTINWRMSSRREVLIRILALLQRKTLIETKNRTLKWHYWTVRSIKNVALLTEDGAFALFFLPHPRGGWAQVELTDALRLFQKLPQK